MRKFIHLGDDVYVRCGDIVVVRQGRVTLRNGIHVPFTRPFETILAEMRIR